MRMPSRVVAEMTETDLKLYPRPHFAGRSGARKETLVIVLNRSATLNKQRYRSIKIPASVAERVHAEMLVSLGSAAQK